MRIAQINVEAGLSTGRIAVELCRLAMRAGHRALLCHARGFAPPDVPSFRIGTKLTKATHSKLAGVVDHARCQTNTLTHVALARLTDRSGFFSRAATKGLVRQLEAFKPDLIHLHNLHGYYLHLPTLFAYLKRKDIPVLWTLHDCWAFTGHCAYYTMAKNAPPLEGSKRRRAQTDGCERWQGGCGRCPLKRLYPSSLLVDQSARNWRQKRALFCGVPHMVLATPSQWLADEVKLSFLKRFPVYVLPNGIDLHTFGPCGDEQYLRNVVSFYQLDDLRGRHLVLSAAAIWEPRKGLEDLIELAQALGDAYYVAAIGLDEYQIHSLPPHTVHGIRRTGNVADLCALYTAAELYVSLSHEESMGMTLVEALACGTQVLCYHATAMPEIVTEDVGEVVPLGDIAAAAEAVRRLCAAPKQAAACYLRAAEYESDWRFGAYLRLYEQMYAHAPKAGKVEGKVE
ncbi:MAG: glycosyltransferase [Clostridia bacterium]